MPAPQLPGASLQAHNDLPAPEPLNLADSPAARPARGASVAKASAARTIKERSRDDSNERVLNPAQVQLIANEPAAQQSVRRHARMAGAGTGINTSSGVPPSSNQNTKAGSKFLRVLKIAFLTLFFISVGAGVFVALLKLRVPTLIIKTTPPGARVILDGKIQEGATPLEVQVTPGQKYRLRIISEGYEEHIVIVRVQDSINAVKYDLVPESKKKAPPGSAFPETP
jgi:hypothetical protein